MVTPMKMCRTLWILFLAGALLGQAGCSATRPGGVAPAPAAPPGMAPPAAELAAPTPPSGVEGGPLAALDPEEIRTLMVDLNLARALDLCGFPALGAFIRDRAQKTIDECPNSAERKAALRSVLLSARLREQRLDDEARAQGVLERCQQPDRLQAIKEMIPTAQRLVVTAERPIECASVPRAER